MSMAHFLHLLMEENEVTSVIIVSDPAVMQIGYRSHDRKMQRKQFEDLPLNVQKQRRLRQVSFHSRWDNAVSLEEGAVVKVIPPMRRASPLRPITFPETDKAPKGVKCHASNQLRQSDLLPRRPNRQASVLRPPQLHRQCSWASSA